MTPDWIDPDERSALEAYSLLKDIGKGIAAIACAFLLLALAALAAMEAL